MFVSEHLAFKLKIIYKNNLLDLPHEYQKLIVIIKILRIMNVKKRRCNNSYREYGFSCIISNGKTRPHCVIGNKVLTNDSLKPISLKQHLVYDHQLLKDKSKLFFLTSRLWFEKDEAGFKWDIS